MSLLLSFAIVGRSWGLLRKSFNPALDAVPEGIDVDGIRTHLLEQPGVHDLHVWAISTRENALTAHLGEV